MLAAVTVQGRGARGEQPAGAFISRQDIPALRKSDGGAHTTLALPPWTVLALANGTTEVPGSKKACPQDTASFEG